jgi:hypothetical protein
VFLGVLSGFNGKKLLSDVRPLKLFGQITYVEIPRSSSSNLEGKISSLSNCQSFGK